MKYSLRSLMIVVTLACLLLGGRIEYLRRWAEFHESEAHRFQRESDRLYVEATKNRLNSFRVLPGQTEEWSSYYHEEMALAYRRAFYCPWMPVHETPDCEVLREEISRESIPASYP